LANSLFQVTERFDLLLIMYNIVVVESDEANEGGMGLGKLWERQVIDHVKSRFCGTIAVLAKIIANPFNTKFE
jgi:hypothetical protein